MDFSGAENYLAARSTRKYFFPKPDGDTVFILEEVEKFLKLAEKYKIEELKKLFEPKTDPLCKKKYFVEVVCEECDLVCYDTQSRTSFFEHLFKILKQSKLLDIDPTNKSISVYVCDECREKWHKENFPSPEVTKEKCREVTKSYIEEYLDPKKTWNDGYKTWEKWNIITQFGINIDEVSSYIRSMDYYDFLKTPYWKAIAEKKRKQASFKCQLCNCNGKLATHHRTYDCHGKEHLNLQDLIVLCDKCHEKFHDIKK